MNKGKHMIQTIGKKGFTLIELLVVVAIIGVLTAVLLVNLVGIRERGADTKKKSDLNQLKNALRLYYNDHQTYPIAGAGQTIMGCGGAACSQTGGSTLNSASGTVYMKEVPEYTRYVTFGGGERFYVGVALTNASDPDAAASQTKCGVISGSEDQGIFYVCTD